MRGLKDMKHNEEIEILRIYNVSIIFLIMKRMKYRCTKKYYLLLKFYRKTSSILNNLIILLNLISNQFM